MIKWIPDLIKVCLGCAILLGSVTGSASASVNVFLDVKREIETAGEVCVGKPISREKLAVDGVMGTLVHFHVHRVVKGSISPGQTIKVWAAGLLGMPESVMIFLKPGTEPYRLTCGNAYLSVDLEHKIPYAYSSDYMNNMLWEFKNALLASADLQVDVRSTFYSRTNMMLNGVLKQAAKIMSASDITAFVSPHLLSDDMRIRATAYAALIESGDTGKILPALDFIDSLPDSSDPVETIRVPLWLDGALTCAKLPAEMVPEVGKRLKGRRAATRHMASYLLRKLENVSAVPYLKQALSDSNVNVRYNGVFGLAMLNRDTRPPSLEEFSADQEKYVDFWRNKTASK